MIEMDYFMELNSIEAEIKRRKARKVLLQFPEGLQSSAVKISKALKLATGAEIVISADPCWGGCDLAETAALKIEADLLVHFGHSPWPKKPKVPTLFVEARSDIEVRDVVLRAIGFLSAKKIGIATTVQHIHKLNEIKTLLEEKGFEVLVGKPSGRAKYAGQILGCDLSSIEKINVDQFLFVGGGTFHPLGIALATGKRVIAADPFSGKVTDMSEEAKRVLMRRYAQIAKAKNVKRFGVVIGLKFGQINLKSARQIKEKIEGKGKEAYLITCEEINPERFAGLVDIEALVITACPRIVIEDGPQFKIPVVTPMELDILLGIRKWGGIKDKETFGYK